MRALDGLVVVITGASRGIGAEMARQFAAEKAKLVLCGRNEKALNDVVASLPLPETERIIVIADLTSADGMKKVVDTAYEKFGVIDIFINNAAVGVRKDISLTTEEEYRLTFDTNVKAVFHSFQELLPRMKKQGGGHIINVSSMASKQGVPGMAVYCASKAAVNIMSEAVAGEVRNDNIKVSVLMPGSTATGFMSHLSEDLKPSPKDKPRLTVRQVAEAAVFLAKQDTQAWTSLVDIRPLRTKSEN